MKISIIAGVVTSVVGAFIVISHWLGQSWMTSFGFDTYTRQSTALAMILVGPIVASMYRHRSSAVLHLVGMCIVAVMGIMGINAVASVCTGSAYVDRLLGVAASDMAYRPSIATMIAFEAVAVAGLYRVMCMNACCWPIRMFGGVVGGIGLIGLAGNIVDSHLMMFGSDISNPIAVPTCVVLTLIGLAMVFERCSDHAECSTKPAPKSDGSAKESQA